MTLTAERCPPISPQMCAVFFTLISKSTLILFIRFQRDKFANWNWNSDIKHLKMCLRTVPPNTEVFLQRF